MSAPAGRWLGLDGLRGLSMIAMILVNNPGGWGAEYQYAPLRHAAWHGCTFTDLVFPTFLFCAGVAIVPALTKKLASGTPRGPLAMAVGRRVLWLVLLGMFLSAFPLVTFEAERSLFAPLLRTRFPGVLQRIGVCYGIAALLFLFAKMRTQRAVLIACLLGYWALITLVPVPGLGAPNLDDPKTLLQGFVDRLVFGDHIYLKGKYDPEGLLSTIPAVATCLLGVEAGRILAASRESAAKVRALLGGAGGLLLIGYAWSFALPFNKELWTSSYAVWTAGIAMAVLGALQWLLDVKGWRRLAYPLQVYGINALLVFVGSGLLARIVGRLLTITVDGKTLSWQLWFFRRALLSWAEPHFASLLFALLWVTFWFVVLQQMFRRGIVWKV